MTVSAKVGERGGGGGNIFSLVQKDIFFIEATIVKCLYKNVVVSKVKNIRYKSVENYKIHYAAIIFIIFLNK